MSVLALSVKRRWADSNWPSWTKSIDVSDRSASPALPCLLVAKMRSAPSLSALARRRRPRPA